MRKISLDVSKLRVESFDTVDESPETRRTVEGNLAPTQIFSCPQTQCGAGCASGPAPCYPTLAWTNGQVACLCNDSLRCID
ncbi:MAG TPA: hypothetical protein VFQ39_16835 [Longimicrobium sp.]|nr:hypothetical protein [Longimicrobium sp.]